VIVVLLVTVTPVATVPPNVTVAPDAKPVPVIVTAVPPLAVPELGAMPLNVGAGFDDPCPLARNVAICMTQALKLASRRSRCSFRRRLRPYPPRCLRN